MEDYSGSGSLLATLGQDVEGDVALQELLDALHDLVLMAQHFARHPDTQLADCTIIARSCNIMSALHVSMDYLHDSVKPQQVYL